MTTSLEKRLETLHTTYPSCGFVGEAPAKRWDDGLVVGNGIQGALAYTRTAAEEIVLSHEELFLPLFPFQGYIPLKEHHREIRKLVLEGHAAEAHELINRLKYEANMPLWNTTDPFVGAASLHLDMSKQHDYGHYIRSVAYDTGEALVAWQDETGLYHRQFFASRAANVIVVRLSSPTGDKLNLSVSLSEIAYDPPKHLIKEDIYGKTIDQCTTSVSENMLTHHMAFKERCENHPIHGSCTLARVICDGGAVVAHSDHIEVQDANQLLLLIRTVPDRRTARISTSEEESKLLRITPDYNALLAAHTTLHKDQFERCRLALSSDDGQQSCESMQASSKVGNTTTALVENVFAAARYGIISSTGTMPPLLQGVWTGTWKPRWSGDYTLNGNVQSMVAASLCGNHYECQETFMDYLDSLMDDFRENANELFGLRGVLIPWRSSTHGKTHYTSHEDEHKIFPGAYWFAGAGWFCQIYYDYYLYTGDETFFQKRLKPFLLDTVACYEDFLVPETEGTYTLCPTSSPENYVAKGVMIAPNATMTIAVIKQLLRTLLRLQDKLDVDVERIGLWQQMLKGLPEYQVGRNGALKEWSWPGIENKEAHRHASHLYPLYFGVDEEIAKSEALQEASRVAIERRMEFRRKEDGGDMSFGIVQLGMSAAHLKDTSLAYECVEYLVNQYWSTAMVSLHNVGDVFNLDISGGLPAVIITMLVQSFQPPEPDQPWKICLLPCLPDAWPHGRLTGVRCRGGFEIDVTWQDGTLKEVTITSLLGNPCQLEYEALSTILYLPAGEQRILSGNLTSNFI